MEEARQKLVFRKQAKKKFKEQGRGYGRPIKYFTKDGVIREGLRKEGISAFFTPTKYFSRVLMNCPAQGTIPWFYNSILPIFEPTVIKGAKSIYSN